MTIENLYKTNINFNVISVANGGTVTVTINCKDYNGNYVTGRNHTAYLIAPNGTQTTLGTGIGASAQDYTFTFTTNDWGIWTVKCNHSKKQIKTTNNFIEAISGVVNNSKVYIVFCNETQVVLKIAEAGLLSASNNSWLNVFGETLPNSPINLRPEVPVFTADFMRKGTWQVSNNGSIYFIREDGGSGNMDEYMSMTWSKQL